MIRVDCRRCKNCTGEECSLYGDDPVKAAKNCAHDNFVNYIPKERRTQENQRKKPLTFRGDYGNGAARKKALANKMLKK